jgi:DNA end-binding protein Ku
MPAGGFWKGYLKLSLVTCPVAMQTAVSDAGRLRLHTINRATGNRVQRQYADAVTGKQVAGEDQARGYPRGRRRPCHPGGGRAGRGRAGKHADDRHPGVRGSDRIGWIWYDRPAFPASRRRSPKRPLR